eukprot:SRR837773.13099.p1 GENE.SRR837773.13099~~SRR837773.13099.p1  ORF type:complete len:334 (-),score=84.68 SRR837773.13099:10-963(-)
MRPAALRILRGHRGPALRVPLAPTRPLARSCGTEASQIPRPTAQQLRRLFVSAAVPFVAFGIVDQSVLIYAGDAIDTTLGVRFGLPTLAAAACGQVLSDTTGVLFGGTIEALATRLGLPLPGLTVAQQRLAVVKRVATFGSVCGVITGCLIGMCNLLIVDLGAAERKKRAEELKLVMNTFVEDGRQVLNCARATLWVVDDEQDELWSFVLQGDGKGKDLRVSLKAQSIVGWVYEHREATNIKNVREDPRWQSKTSADYAPSTMLVAPVIASTGKVLAVIQVLDKMDEGGNIIPFGHNDELMVQMLSGHARVVMEANS